MTEEGPRWKEVPEHSTLLTFNVFNACMYFTRSKTKLNKKKITSKIWKLIKVYLMKWCNNHTLKNTQVNIKCDYILREYTLSKL